MYILEGLKPENVFKRFEEISRIPRGSGNEKELARFCVKFAEQRGLFAASDKYNNVLIRKPASKGMESSGAVILQGHLDMVCEKNAGVEHDFNKDPLKLIVNGDDIMAEGTTLGADNGIAVAMILAVLDEDTPHPALECLLTSEEEVGLVGAINFDYSQLTGNRLINLDAEQYGKVVVSCAGGLKAETSLHINWVDTALSDAETYAIRVRGLKGGHSGGDIHLDRANANKLIGRTLDFLFGKIDLELCAISGGSKDNAIPRESQAYINISSGDAAKLEALLSGFENTLTDEYRFQENGLSIKCSAEQYRQKVFDRETAQKAIEIIMATPNGVLMMSHEIDGLVETSNNLGVINTKDDEVAFSCAARSAVPSRKQLVETMIRSLAQLAGARFTSGAQYPGWRYEPNSPLRSLACKAFKDLTGSELKPEATHGGLECGIILERLKDADALSFGPDMWDVHTPDERLSISSVEKTYEFLLRLLEVC